MKDPSTPFTLKPWPSDGSTPAGEPASCASSWANATPNGPSPANARSSAGSTVPALARHPRVAGLSRRRRAPLSPTTPGKRMPANRCACARASVSVGCVSSTNARGRSCGPKFFPQGKWLTVPPTFVQAEFRQAFRHWGRPDTMRVDNGGPWGSDGDWPPDLALWLIGCVITVHYNDPHSPTQYAVVERSQGTGKRWADPEQCDTPEELQVCLHYADRVQREVYPSIEGQSRAAAYPGLKHSGRPYSLRLPAKPPVGIRGKTFRRNSRQILLSRDTSHRSPKKVTPCLLEKSLGRFGNSQSFTTGRSRFGFLHVLSPDF